MSGRSLLSATEEHVRASRDEESNESFDHWSESTKNDLKASISHRSTRNTIGKWTRVGLEFTICVFLVINAILMFRNRGSSGSRTLGEDKPRNFHLKYGSDSEYMSLDHKYDHHWDDYLEGHNGMIRINPEQDDQEPEWGAIGMFHQLHCLAAFRKALQASHEGEDIGTDQNDNSHWPHCLHYMRQAIHCNADDTIERGHTWGSKILDNNTIGVVRWGIIDGITDWRTCRDSDRLYYLRAKHGYGVEKDRLKQLNDSQESEGT